MNGIQKNQFFMSDDGHIQGGINFLPLELLTSIDRVKMYSKVVIPDNALVLIEVIGDYVIFRSNKIVFLHQNRVDNVLRKIAHRAITKFYRYFNRIISKQ